MDEKVIYLEIVSEETARLAKDLGFDEQTEFYLNEKGKLDSIDRYRKVFWSRNSSIKLCSKITVLSLFRDLSLMVTLPLKSSLQTWIRKTFGYHISVYEEFGNYILLIHFYDKYGNKNEIWKHKGPHLSHEKALETGLFESLKLIKNGLDKN